MVISSVRSMRKLDLNGGRSPVGNINHLSNNYFFNNPYYQLRKRPVMHIFGNWTIFLHSYFFFQRDFSRVPFNLLLIMIDLFNKL